MKKVLFKACIKAKEVKISKDIKNIFLFSVGIFILRLGFNIQRVIYLKKIKCN